jgi:AraC family transcriptional regulator
MTSLVVAGGVLGGRPVSYEVAGFVFTITALPGSLRLPRHAHERANINVVLSGEYAESTLGRTRSHPSSSIIVKPPGADHANALSARGARCVVLELTQDRLAALDRHRRMFDDVRSAVLGAAHTLAVRAAAELATPDALSPLVLEGLALEIVGSAGRATSRIEDRAVDRPRAAWLERAGEIMRDAPEGVTLSALASAVGLHPVYVARAFRARYGCAVGEYARRLRIGRAARELADGTQPLAVIAAQAGFADQSHFSRVFRRHTGLSPSAYRRHCRA